MMRTSKTQPHHDDEEEDDTEYGDEFSTPHDPSSQKGEVGKIDGKKSNTTRSKHSETEQRRRSKINERFQILRELIPQNDQKRDKASFLLEVIEYIHFLHEKLQMYEGSHPEYGQEARKLIPWRSGGGSVESHLQNSQLMKNGVSQENMSPPMLTTARNLVEPDLQNAAVSMNMEMQPSMFVSAGRGGISSESVQESIYTVGNMFSHTQPQPLQVLPLTKDCAVSDTAETHQEQPTTGSGNFSNAYTQGIYNSLTQALQSSGVDLSQTNISVQIDVVKRAASEVACNSSGSKECENPSDNRGVALGTENNYGEECDQAHKRLRTEKG